MKKRLVYGLLILVFAACEPFNLTRKEFAVCAKPGADIGVTIDRLDVTFFLRNRQGDIGVAGWDPGDGKGRSRVGSRVTYNYEKAGRYVVTLTLVNSCDDRFTATETITVGN